MLQNIKDLIYNKIKINEVRCATISFLIFKWNINIMKTDEQYDQFLKDHMITVNLKDNYTIKELSKFIDSINVKGDVTHFECPNSIIWMKDGSWYILFEDQDYANCYMVHYKAPNIPKELIK